ncbi:MAG: GNAT family N-acetyltransferase [Alphaproteobacteria bacterium]|nr:GNAT family N-acetyltransferase [Alphaproteobacteria bacterium]MBM4437394.1 GNAT family N-acetyltransferase [Actinomycetota bacterium]
MIAVQSRVTVRVAEASDALRWDSFLDEQAAGWPLARFRWSAFLRDTFGATPYFLMVEDSSHGIAGVLAAYAAESGGQRMVYSMSRGLVARDPETQSLLLAEAERLATRLAAGCMLSLRTPPGGNYEVKEKASVALTLERTVEDTWGALRAKTRNMIRKADRAGVSIERGFHNLRVFYEVYARRMLEVGVPIQRVGVLRQIEAFFADRAELMVARVGTEVVGGILTIFGSRSAVYPLQATATAHMDSAATQRLVWEAATICIQRGISSLDMGESRIGSPVYQSKVNFGGAAETVYDCSVRAQPHARRFSSLLERPAWLALRSPFLAVRRPAGLWLGTRRRLAF